MESTLPNVLLIATNVNGDDESALPNVLLIATNVNGDDESTLPNVLLIAPNVNRDDECNINTNIKHVHTHTLDVSYTCIIKGEYVEYFCKEIMFCHRTITRIQTKRQNNNKHSLELQVLTFKGVSKY